jgi:uncharacterized protein
MNAGIGKAGGDDSGIAESRRDTAKLVLAGPMGAGKTTAIRAITDGASVSTDTPMSEGEIGGKSTTTVALDFSTVVLGDGTELLVYGLPGQDHFAFMRPIVMRDAFGIIVLLDGRQDGLHDACELWLRECATHAPDATIVVGVTHTDLMSKFSLTPLREAARRLGRPVPVFTFDARSRPQTLQLVRALLVAAS